MDHETGAYGEADAGSAFTVDGARPLAPFALLVSLVAIAAVALLLCGLVVVIVLLILTARLGGEGRVEYLQDLRFDLPLRLRLGAGAVGVFYAGVGIATIAAALWQGRAGWTGLVALNQVRYARRRTLALFLASLGYAAVASLALDRMQTHRVIIDGPTDLLLVATIVTNLVLLAPLSEELVFRGWLYTGLRQRFGFWPSFLVTTLAFAAIHWDPNHRRILLVLPLAVALGLLREIAGSIKPTILLHGCYNLIIVALTLASTA